MEPSDAGELKREFSRELDAIRQDVSSFKRRTSIIANLFVPGLGFLIYGHHYLRGLIAVALFAFYNLLFFSKILPHTDTGIAVLYYMPAVAIWLVSTLLVAGLDD